MVPDPIDLSPLDPARDGERWERFTRAVVARAIEARRDPHPILEQLISWARPAIAIAAGLSLVLFLTLVMTRRGEVDVSSVQQDPTSSFAEWATSEKMPDTTAVLTLFGG